jgi:hypothetical protein
MRSKTISMAESLIGPEPVERPPQGLPGQLDLLGGPEVRPWVPINKFATFEAAWAKAVWTASTIPLAELVTLAAS